MIHYSQLKKDCCKVNGSMTQSLYCLTSEQNAGLMW